MISDISKKITLTITNKKYWIPIFIFYCIGLFSIPLIVSQLSNNYKFIIIAVPFIVLFGFIMFLHSSILSVHEVILLSLIEMKNQENEIQNLKSDISRLELRINPPIPLRNS